MWFYHMMSSENMVGKLEDNRSEASAKMARKGEASASGSRNINASTGDWDTVSRPARLHTAYVQQPLLNSTAIFVPR